jgi:hypothetical protein
MKFGCLATGGVLGGDTAQLLSWIPRNVNVFALAWVAHAAFRSCTRVPPSEPVSEIGARCAGLCRPVPA